MSFERLSTRLVAAVFTLAMLPATALAQAWPSKPIRIVVPFAAGGPSDMLPRLIAPRLAQALGQPVVVENRPGGSGNIGMELVAKAAPDGYTFVVGPNGNVVVNPNLYAKLPYDVNRDFAPVTLVAAVQNVLVVGADSKARTVADLIAQGKARPGALSYASPGNGSQAHMAAEYLKMLGGIYAVHIPYNGVGAALNDLLGGRIDFMFAQTSAAMPQVQAGKLRALAFASKERLAIDPSLPIVAETLPGFEAVSWYGLLAPAGTSPEVIARVQQEVAKAVRVPEIAEKLAGMGAAAVASTPEQFAQQIRGEQAQYARIIQRAGIKVE
ncbi:MAG: tripartite tricarboxylate transporter substrate binding protein [Rubrivivax sp.]|nr:tripartite tricarboxylate transporter substrate binding protein [Rubrivivax sp.]